MKLVDLNHLSCNFKRPQGLQSLWSAWPSWETVLRTATPYSVALLGELMCRLSGCHQGFFLMAFRSALPTKPAGKV